ncbi:MAG: Holliday junction resolvase RuvX [Bacteroidota bacterium]
MGRIMGIDYGSKRTGIAVTDPLRLIAQGLETVPTESLFPYLERYFKDEIVDQVVVGLPRHPDGNPTPITHLVIGFVRKLSKQYPALEVFEWEERFTSVAAQNIILQSGAKKSKRQDKGLVDTISAALILEDFMQQKHW